MGKTLKVGITGGIGSGKTVVSDYLKSLGYPIVYADEVAKQVMKEDEEVKKKIVEAFGEEAYSGEEINKEYLAEKIFASKENVELINSIVHPPTIKRIKDLVYENAGETDFVFVESALIYESKFYHFFDHVILIVADEDIKIRRLLERGEGTVEEIKRKMASQWQDSAKQDKADFILANNGTPEELYGKIDFILHLMKRMH
jgi:dephospho-CoA kinase